MGTKKSDKHQLFTRTYTNQTTSWLVRSLNTFGACMNHGQTQTHKTYHSSDLGEATTFPLYTILCVWPRGQHPNGILSQDSKVRVPKFPKLGFLQLWKPITLCADIRLKWSLTQSWSPCRDLSNNMWHATCTQRNQGNSWLFSGWESNWPLTLSLSFGHNLF